MPSQDSFVRFGTQFVLLKHCTRNEENRCDNFTRRCRIKNELNRRVEKCLVSKLVGLDWPLLWALRQSVLERAMQTLSMVMLADMAQAITIVQGDTAPRLPTRIDLWLLYRTMVTVVTTVSKVALVTEELATRPTAPTEQSQQFHLCH